MNTDRTKEQKREANCLQLLASVATENITTMDGDASLKMVRQLAYQHWSNEHQQEYQVHVLVIRDPDEFLQPFVTEETT